MKNQSYINIPLMLKRKMEMFERKGLREFETFVWKSEIKQYVWNEVSENEENDKYLGIFYQRGNIVNSCAFLKCQFTFINMLVCFYKWYM